jgi:hypothetical protein
MLHFFCKLPKNHQFYLKTLENLENLGKILAHSIKTIKSKHEGKRKAAFPS